METDRPVSSLLASVSKDLSDIARLDPSRADFAQQAEELRFLSEDLAARIREYVGTIAADPERLEVVEERIQLVRSLKRKYGATIPEILAARKSCAAELAVIENRDEALVRAEAACTKACDKALAASARLSACREAAAGAFEERVEKEMRELQLPRAVFKVAVARRPRGGESSTEMFPGTGTAPSGEGSGARIRPQAAFLTATGDDVVEFLVSLNPGEEPRPLRRVASGGEVSRIMLSIKAVLAERDEIPTLVFDEIDIGVSGEAAARVAEKLFRLGGTHQVICVTHLPQIAARGSTHLAVEKKVVRGRTLASVRVVGGEERADTIARMLSGKDLDEESRRYARKLLGKSR
jgi:DNA repair protein RecN (Recombination protein N)